MNHKAPIASVCTVANRHSLRDVWLMVRSLRLHHRDLEVLIISDSHVERAFEDRPFVRCRSLLPDIERPQSPADPRFMKIMNYKMTAMDWAFRHHPSTLYVDADVCFLAPIESIDLNRNEVAFSPHEIPMQHEAVYGRYNAGYVATRSCSFPAWWRGALARSKYVDQACLEYAVGRYRVQELGPEHNFGWWRPLFAGDRDSATTVSATPEARDSQITVAGRPLISVHSHFYSDNRLYADWNTTVRSLLATSTSENHRKVLEWL